FKEHQRSAVKKSTLKSYGNCLELFRERFATIEVTDVSADQVGKFLEACTGGLSRSTATCAMPKSRRSSTMSSK
ncbi:MAG: hypothetical protein ACWGQW_07070, partial [bacterium]